MAIALLVGLTSLPQTLFSAYGEVDADRMTANYEKDAGFRWAYLTEAGFFLYVILSNYKNISNKAKDVMMLNIALIFCAILLVFIRSENGGRLGWMFMIGVLCTLSNICVKNKKILSQGLLVIVVCFLLFFRILNGWGVLVSPYKTFLTDGYRGGDFIHDNYEYDSMYDENKFYRPAFWFLEE